MQKKHSGNMYYPVIILERKYKALSTTNRTGPSSSLMNDEEKNSG